MRSGDPLIGELRPEPFENSQGAVSVNVLTRSGLCCVPGITPGVQNADVLLRLFGRRLSPRDCGGSVRIRVRRKRTRAIVGDAPDQEQPASPRTMQP